MPLAANETIHLFDNDNHTQSGKAKRRKQRKAIKSLKQGNTITPPLEARNPRQADLIDSLNTATQIFAVGEAGTGKTYIPARMSIQRLQAGSIEKIYIARPTVSDKRHKQGFLPGNLDKKLAPWLVPLMQAFKSEVSATVLASMLTHGQIEFLSFEHLRGRTLENCVVILDEAQNCSFSDLKLFLTRKGENCTYVVNGDPTQVDIDDSGLETILDIIEKYEINADIIEFLPEDVVRSADAREWVEAFSKWSIAA